MNPALLILIYAFVFVVILIVATESYGVDRVIGKEKWSNDSATARQHALIEDSAPVRQNALIEDSAEVESFDLWSGDAGTRIGDHTITYQSDLPDFDSFSDSWDDSWGHDDW